jgi:hypothetical protein
MNKLKQIEDFPGVVILANEHGLITMDQLNQAVFDYLDDQNGGDFTTWLETQTMISTPTPMTKEDHLQRGTCCNNGCVNCPWR